MMKSDEFVINSFDDFHRYLQEIDQREQPWEFAKLCVALRSWVDTQRDCYIPKPLEYNGFLVWGVLQPDGGFVQQFYYHNDDWHIMRFEDFEIAADFAEAMNAARRRRLENVPTVAWK